MSNIVNRKLEQEKTNYSTLKIRREGFRYDYRKNTKTSNSRDIRSFILKLSRRLLDIKIDYILLTEKKDSFAKKLGGEPYNFSAPRVLHLFVPHNIATAEEFRPYSYDRLIRVSNIECSGRQANPHSDSSPKHTMYENDSLSM